MPRIQLRWLAHARSGDKGDTANVGLIALDPAWYPLLVKQVSRARVARHFKGMVKGVDRFELPNLNALNFLLHGALDGGGMTGDHDLLGCVEIDGFDDLALGALHASFRDRGCIESEDGCHRSLPGRHRLLHGLGAQFDQWHRIAESQYPCGNQRRILAEAVAGNHVRYPAALVQPQAIDGNAGRQHQRLSVYSLVECLARPFGDELPEIAAKCS